MNWGTHSSHMLDDGTLGVANFLCLALRNQPASSQVWTNSLWRPALQGEPQERAACAL